MKYSLTKHVKKRELVELFLNLSDSFDENIPDVIWAGSEFEVNIPEDDVSCDISYVSTKKGGEFAVKVSWITKAGKKELEKEALEKSKQKLEKARETRKKTSGKKGSPKPVELASDEEIWAEDGGWELSSEDEDWEDEDFDDEW